MEMKPKTVYQATFDEAEYTLLTRALGLMAGITGVRVKTGDAERAIELNHKMLEQQAAYYRQALRVIEGKIEKADGAAREEVGARVVPNCEEPT
jgi:hypothetical protein